MMMVMAAVENPYNKPLVNELKCQYCTFVGVTLRGTRRHEAACPAKRVATKPIPTTNPAPITLGSTAVQDPASKMMNRVLENLVSQVRSTKLESVTISHQGNKWSVCAQWIE